MQHFTDSASLSETQREYLSVYKLLAKVPPRMRLVPPRNPVCCLCRRKDRVDTVLETEYKLYQAVQPESDDSEGEDNRASSRSASYSHSVSRAPADQRAERIGQAPTPSVRSPRYLLPTSPSARVRASLISRDPSPLPSSGAQSPRNAFSSPRRYVSTPSVLPAQQPLTAAATDPALRSAALPRATSPVVLAPPAAAATAASGTAAPTAAPPPSSSPLPSPRRHVRRALHLRALPLRASPFARRRTTRRRWSATPPRCSPPRSSRRCRSTCPPPSRRFCKRPARALYTSMISAL